ncbi:hypothetical protein V6N13_131968 [Hibiscus sabdariffa]
MPMFVLADGNPGNHANVNALADGNPNPLAGGNHANVNVTDLAHFQAPNPVDATGFPPFSALNPVNK